jgi:hypothetical protein
MTAHKFVYIETKVIKDVQKNMLLPTHKYTALCTDVQHAISSHELQSALMLTVEFSKMYCTW